MRSFLLILVLTIVAAVVTIIPEIAPSLLARIAFAAAIVLLGAGAALSSFLEDRAQQIGQAERDRTLLEMPTKIVDLLVAKGLVKPAQAEIARESARTLVIGAGAMEIPIRIKATAVVGPHPEPPASEPKP
jgi:hypothetical protein